MTTQMQQPRQQQTKKKLREDWLKELALIVTLCGVACLGVVSIFGDNIRRMFGMSADALGGDDGISARASTGSGPGLVNKTMKSFGQNNVYGGSGGSWAPVQAPANGDTHVAYVPNATVEAARDSLSTFAIDVDRASYTYGLQSLRGGMLPQPASVRVEEWVNAFPSSLPDAKELPYAVHTSLARAPFDAGKVLLKVSLQGKRIPNAARKPADLVWLVDVSGSMSGEARLGLAQESMRIMLEGLREQDTVAIVTYAGAVRDVLPPTHGNQKARIRSAIDALTSGGGTAMGDGMKVAYQHAVSRVRGGAVSRVMVFSDGDANIGYLGHQQILEQIAAHVKEGVMLTTIGFGMGNYRASDMEQLADKGNGQSLYIDTRDEAQRVFGPEGLAGTLETIAKDVKVQVAFDAKKVKSYRLVGYENRDVADQDFRNDAVDGGEIGAGHAVTALYELEVTGDDGELAVATVRGQRLDGKGAFEVASKVVKHGKLPGLADAEVEMRFASAVALSADQVRTSSPDAEKLVQLTRIAAGATEGRLERAEYVRYMEGALKQRFPEVAAR
jgi:Ca-activated chloride channel homolog